LPVRQGIKRKVYKVEPDSQMALELEVLYQKFDERETMYLAAEAEFWAREMALYAEIDNLKSNYALLHDRTQRFLDLIGQRVRPTLNTHHRTLGAVRLSSVAFSRLSAQERSRPCLVPLSKPELPPGFVSMTGPDGETALEFEPDTVGLACDPNFLDK
jgi:hypothetical protein